MTLKMALLAPIPRARVRTAMMVKRGRFEQHPQGIFEIGHHKNYLSLGQSDHSARRAMTGSMREALRAGSQQASPTAIDKDRAATDPGKEVRRGHSGPLALHQANKAPGHHARRPRNQTRARSRLGSRPARMICSRSRRARCGFQTHVHAARLAARAIRRVRPRPGSVRAHRRARQGQR